MKRHKKGLKRKVNSKSRKTVFGMIPRIALLLFCLAISLSSYAQNKKIQGTIHDPKGETIIGATVVVAGTQRGTVTDIDGKFSLVAGPQESLTITYIGYQAQTIKVGDRTEFIVIMEENKMLEEVVVVAYGTQKKESMISSIETINPQELKVPSSNLTTALAGRLSGVIAYQRSGEPGKDNADFFIRGVTTFGYKKDPLILIDGIETTSTELARLSPDDIEAFSILKDATATALYGARGANGVIQIKTKEGKEGPVQVSVRIENSFSQNTQNVKLANPVTYMELYNEAVNTRLMDGQSRSPFSPEKIDQTRRGANPLVYPANDWRDLLIKDMTSNQRANLSLSGGGGVAHYYVAASYTKDNGNLNVDKQNNFNNNIDLRSYQLRSNINLYITKTTEAIVRLAGSFDDYSGPLDGGEAMYKKLIQASPVAFPAYYPASYNSKAGHVLFGNEPRLSDPAGYMNPYADLVKGYKESTKSLIDAAFEVKQDFDFITKGLKARALFNTSRYSFFDVSRQYIPYYYGVMNYDRITDTVDGLRELRKGEEYLNYAPGGKDINSTIYIEAAMIYNRAFNKVHDISALLVYNQREQLYSNKETLQLSLPYRNQGVSGRFTYGYDSRYMAEFNFGYNGSERFHKKERFGFFPAVGAGWIVSNEKFWEGLEKTFPKLKLKGTYGLVGNDAIGDEKDRFFYLSEVEMHDGGRGYAFGTGYNYPNVRDGVGIKRYENKDITWETAYKTNLGIELNILGNLEFQADYFTEHRKNILMERESLPSTLGLAVEKPKANIGEAKSRGFEFSIDYNKYFTSGYWLQSRANFTYAHSEFLVYEEPAYNEKYKSRVGNPINQQYGLIAERLFVDEYEVMNSPLQTYGEYMAGDIKYRDVNGDGQITDLDIVPLGYPSVPEIVYGFGASFGNKSFDVSIFFQGQARSSFWIDVEKVSPFQVVAPDDKEPYTKDIPILDAFAKSHWSESDRNLYALWPRLSDELNKNNTQKSSWFMYDGAFLRLKTVEIGYRLPESLLKKANLTNTRFYITGNNLFAISGFDLWDIEMGGNGLGYPLQRVFNVGVQIGF